MAYVSFENVVRQYGEGDAAVYALDGATFQAEQGELAVILGASGAGKTTALNILGGMDSPTSGEVFVAGRDIAKLTGDELVEYRRADIGFVFQFYNLVQNLTALENVELAAQICRDPLDAEEVLRHVGLGERLNNFPAQLSGGEQQRVAIARALALHPDILCFDEPTSALDPELTGEVLRVLRELADRKTTMIIVTHEMHFARDVADRILFMDGGVVVEEGPAKQLIDHPREQRTKQFLAHYAE